MIAPATVVQSLYRDVAGDIAFLDSVLHTGRDPAVGAERVLTLETLEGEAVLHLETDCAAERIETKHRVVRLDVGAADGVGRDEIEVHRVAERLVDAHAIHVDRKALRLARHRRGDKSAIADVRLEAVAQ